MKAVKNIIEDYLKKHGFDGLYYPGECSCKIGDLQPCDSPCMACEPGYITSDPSGEYDYLIGAKKPKP
ncbi:MAG TPA: hypothetical protein ENH82_15765 [bacterium]|nr:hypothetical protein [bacterium]